MPNVKNVLIGTGFLSLAVYTYLQHGSPWMIGLLFAASVYLFVIAFTGLSAGGLDDLNDAVEFVQNPTRAIADKAVDEIAARADPAASRVRRVWADFVAEVRGDERPGAAPAKPFDPDAVMARYLAERPQRQQQQAEGLASPPAARPTFGRKKA